MNTYEHDTEQLYPFPDPTLAIAQAMTFLTYRRINGHLPGREEHTSHRVARQRDLTGRLRHAGQVSLASLAARAQRWSDSLGTGHPTAA